MLKVFLHLSKDEQRKRLQARLDDPAKRWKFRLDDLENRRRWDEYARRYEAGRSAPPRRTLRPGTSSRPTTGGRADRPSTTLLATTLEGMNPQVPPPLADLEGVVIESRGRWSETRRLSIRGVVRPQWIGDERRVQRFRLAQARRTR